MYKHIGKRLFDILASLTALIVLSPLMLLIAVAVKCTSEGPVFYVQQRVGMHNKNLSMLKFRTMTVNADKKGLLTVGENDSRITDIGRLLRKTKMDELPQLFNILKGDMSVVGPRPEVRYYVNYYTTEQMQVLAVRPGLTDLASLAYIDENKILAACDNPQQTYIEKIMQEKLSLNFEYIRQISFGTDMKIIGKTLLKIIHRES